MSFTIKLPPPPTILDLIPRYFLTDRQLKQVFENHDPGDEDRSTRRYGTLVERGYFFRDQIKK